MVVMENTIHELEILIATYHQRFLELEEDVLSGKPQPGKWSKKEVIGHLIDSAHNNMRRFICGQYDDPEKSIVYDPDVWVRANDYQNLDSGAIISLWKAINEQLCRVLAAMPKEAYAKQCNTAFKGVELHSLQWLAEDYVRHMKHHLNQVFPGEFNVLYVSR